MHVLLAALLALPIAALLAAAPRGANMERASSSTSSYEKAKASVEKVRFGDPYGLQHQESTWLYPVYHLCVPCVGTGVHTSVSYEHAASLCDHPGMLSVGVTASSLYSAL